MNRRTINAWLDRWPAWQQIAAGLALYFAGMMLSSWSMLAGFAVAIAGGAVLGRLAAWLMFRRM